MSVKEIILITIIIISALLLLFTTQKIIEFRRKNIITSKQAMFYVAITFIQPAIGFVLIIPFIKRGY